MKTTFLLNRVGIAELMLSPVLAADIERRVENIAKEAKAIAPVVTGNYQDNIESGTFHDGDRVTGYVQAKADYSIDVEVRQRVLGRALHGGDDS